MLKVLTGEAKKGYKNKNRRKTIQIMNKYTQLKKFQHDHQLQVYMYAFMHVDPETMPAKDKFPSIKSYVENHKKTPTPGPVPKHWLRFSYI